MGKKNQFALILCLLCWTSSRSATVGLKLNSPTSRINLLCDVPPPDNFRVSARGASFLELSWNPIAVGVTHTLLVLTKTESSDWVLFDSIYNITGNSYAINDLDINLECKLQISTNCTSGEPSIYNIIIEEKIILELETVGRIPLNPEPTHCMELDLGVEWKGFRVKPLNDNANRSNLFEIQVSLEGSHDTVRIKRVFEESFIKAANTANEAPLPVIHPQNPFKIIKIESIPETIGWVAVSLDLDNNTISVCPNQSQFPWNNLYEFTALTATDIIEGSFPEGDLPKDHSENILTKKNKSKFKVQNPFSENLKLFMLQPNIIDEKITIVLFNTFGQVIFEQKAETPFEYLSFPVSNISSGIYMLQIQSEYETEMMELLKID